MADVLSSAAAVAECVAEDDRDATKTGLEEETESIEVAANSANDLVIVSSHKEN